MVLKELGDLLVGHGANDRLALFPLLLIFLDLGDHVRWQFILKARVKKESGYLFHLFLFVDVDVLLAPASAAGSLLELGDFSQIAE